MNVILLQSEKLVNVPYKYEKNLNFLAVEFVKDIMTEFRDHGTGDTVWYMFPCQVVSVKQNPEF